MGIRAGPGNADLQIGSVRFTLRTPATACRFPRVCLYVRTAAYAGDWSRSGVRRSQSGRGRQVRLQFACLIRSAVTCRTHRAPLFSPGATNWKGPSLSDSGLPSRFVTMYTALSVNVESNSAHANTAR